jgi:predicted DNA-binding transcriptional regulator AlpA
MSKRPAEPASERRERTQPRRGLRREEAAAYVGMSARKFDALVRRGDMPKPKRVDSLPVWDIVKLDYFFELLPDDGASVPDANSGRFAR